jgi:hypothetical protein
MVDIPAINPHSPWTVLLDGLVIVHMFVSGLIDTVIEIRRRVADVVERFIAASSDTHEGGYWSMSYFHSSSVLGHEQYEYSFLLNLHKKSKSMPSSRNKNK